MEMANGYKGILFSKVFTFSRPQSKPKLGVKELNQNFGLLLFGTISTNIIYALVTSAVRTGSAQNRANTGDRSVR